MKVFKQVNFKRNYECTNVVAVVAEQLPERFRPDLFQPTDDQNALNGLMFIGAETQNGQRCELYGYL